MGGQWYFVAHPGGTWGFVHDAGMEIPVASYLIGFVPEPLKPGECRSINIVAESRHVWLNRKTYCGTGDSVSLDPETAEGTTLGTRMRQFANSRERGSIKASMHAF